jgi:mono/diheme cytochrome c family protein
MDRLGMSVAGWALFLSIAVLSQEATDGMYTTAQADRGRDVYLSSCARCHGERMLGNDDATPLVGRLFMDVWAKKTVAELFELIRLEMPSDGPGVLTRRESSDVTAFLLRANAFPPGPRELGTSERALAGLRLESDP